MSAIGLINSVANLGGFVGPYLVGHIHELTGSFTASFLAIGGLLVCTAALALGLSRSPTVVRVTRATEPDASAP